MKKITVGHFGFIKKVARICKINSEIFSKYLNDNPNWNRYVEDELDELLKIEDKPLGGDKYKTDEDEDPGNTVEIDL